MGIRLPKSKAMKPIQNDSSSESEEVEHHTDSADQDTTDDSDVPSQEEYHTDSGDEDDEEGEDEDAVADLDVLDEDEDDASDASAPAAPSAPLLPAELLKSRDDDVPAIVTKPWEQLSRKEKKALRDERGISMRELREEALASGALQAGIAAKVKRGLLPAEKVAGGRISKSKSRQSKKQRIHAANTNQTVPRLSGKQALINQRAEQQQKSGKGGIRAGRGKKG